MEIFKINKREARKLFNENRKLVIMAIYKNSITNSIEITKSEPLKHDEDITLDKFINSFNYYNQGKISIYKTENS